MYKKSIILDVYKLLQKQKKKMFFYKANFGFDNAFIRTMIKTHLHLQNSMLGND